MKTIFIFILLNTFFAYSNNNFEVCKKPLSLEITAFSGSANDGVINLEWTMFEDINTSHFIIEYSANSLFFNEIGKLSVSENNEQKTYSFVHTSPISEDYNYYRLKIVDNKGGFVYSEIISVYADKSKKFDISILNNPTISQTLNIIATGANGKDVEISIRDFSGNLVYAATLNKLNGYILYDKTILSGTYIITGVLENDLISKKIIITK